MIDHIGLNVRDVARATEFYLKALGPLGYGIVMQVSAEERGGSRGGRLRGRAEAVVLDRRGRAQERADACRLRGAKPGRGRCLLCCGDQGRRQGQWPPGLRPEYHANYYGAFVFDPDGNNAEAVCTSCLR